MGNVCLHSKHVINLRRVSEGAKPKQGFRQRLLIFVAVFWQPACNYGSIVAVAAAIECFCNRVCNRLFRVIE